MEVGRKYRGAYLNVIRKYVVDRLTGRGDIDYSRLFITHTTTPREICDAVRETVESIAKFDRIYETDAGPTIACHCGPCTLGILFKRKAN
jgi:fatty acid-binding protein DegV